MRSPSIRARSRLTFSGKQSGRTILNVVDFPILSKAFYTRQSLRFLAAEPAARLRPLQGRPRGRRGSGSNMSASPTIGARISPVNRGQNNFDRIRIEFYQDRQAASRPSRRARSSTGRNSPRGSGRRTTTSRPSLPARWSSANFPAKPSLHAGHRRQPAARAVSRRARAAGDRALLRLRMDTAQLLLRLLRALAILLREVRLSRRRHAFA